jgi:hypothetical protein
MTTTQNDPSISDLLDVFFAGFQPDADGLSRRRIAIIREDLMDHMDGEGWRVLDPAQTVLLETERQFRPTGAFSRSARASDLFCVLEHYLTPQHAQAGIDQRATQLDVVDALVTKLWRDKLISISTVSRGCRTEYDVALKQGRSLVNEARRREALLLV